MPFEVTKEKILNLIPRLNFKFPYTAEEWAENLYVENYHKHTDFSNNAVTDSAEQMENYAIETVKRGNKCLFSGEHGSQGNQFATYKIAKEHNLKYRHSAEAYWVVDRKANDRANCHIVIVAKNPEGREDLNYILSMANIDGYYYQPRIDLELLLSVPPNNLIITSACIAGWKYENAEECWLKIANHFKCNFYCEIQCHNTQKQKMLNRRILDFANKHSLPIICGLDSHYCVPDKKVQREMLIEEKGIEYNDDEADWFMDWPDSREIIKRLSAQNVLTEKEILLSMMNTNVFVNECQDINFSSKFKIPNIYKDLSYKERVILFKKMIQKAYNEDPLKSKEKMEGIRWEVEQYVDSQTVDYPLLSKAIVDLAVSKYSGVLTTTSRGSAASFITNKYMGLTTVDRFNAEIPIYPERFLTKDRILAGSLPDVDLNVAAQEPFVEAARELLGEYGCYPLMTLSKLKEKEAWKMYSRLNDVPHNQADELSKQLDRYNEDLKYADEEEKDLIHIQDYVTPEYFELYRESIPFQGITRKCGVHACGHLVTDKDIRREIGLISAVNETTKKRVLCAAVEGQYLDEFGYVKEDFLIVDVVSLIDELFKSIGQKVPSFEDLKKMVKDDQPTWDIYKNGIVCCVNQCEKEATKRKAMRYQPKEIAGLSSFIAGIRPGFASLINSFLSRENYSTGEPLIDELLQDSSHYMLYQESIMKVLSFLGLPMTETYNVIKSISKKKLKGAKKDHLLEELKQGWLEKFGNLDNFQNVWKVIEDAAAYSFNACVSGDTKIMRGAKGKNHYAPTVEEMFMIRNSYSYAKTTGHKSLHDKYKRNGYGTALSLYDDGKIHNNTIVDIRESGIQKIFRVTVDNGSFIDCTMTHKFPTPDNGVIALSELKIGDLLFVKGDYEKSNFNKRFTDNESYSNVPQKGQRGFQFNEDGPSVLFRNKRNECVLRNEPCMICGKSYSVNERFELHHVDGDRTNNHDDNLKWLCNSCHKSTHYQMGRKKRYDKGIPVLVSPIVSIDYLRTDKTYDIEMADPAHNFVTESGLVASNSHSYSMAGDSLYCAWFKAHHTSKFYEVAISHYQNKKTSNKKKKISALLKEAKDCFGYQRADYKFRADNRSVNIDDEKKIINPNLSSVKDIGDSLATALWEISQEQSDVIHCFTDLLYHLRYHPLVKMNQIKKLIRINYFSEFGNQGKLLKLFELFNDCEIYKMVQVKKSKIESLGLPYDLVKECSIRETDKQFSGFNPMVFLKKIEEQLPNDPVPVSKIISNQLEILEDINYIDETADDNVFFVTDTNDFKKFRVITAYGLKTGRIITFKIWSSQYFAKVVEKNDLIRLEFTKKNKVRRVSDEEYAATNKRYAPIPGEYENWFERGLVIEKGAD